MKRPLVLTVMLIACRPEIDDDASLLQGPRVLAVRSEPAEARPGEKVTLTAFYTDGTNAVATAPLGWSFCTARKPLADPSPLDPGCLYGETATAIGGGAAVSALLAADACRAFGPDRPLAKPGEPAGRPADPDATGGFFQPGWVGGSGSVPTLFEVRLRCALPSVPQEVSRAYEAQYHPNTNPEIAAVERVRAGTPEALGDVLTLTPGENAALRVSWAVCQSAPCSGAEPFVSYDAASRTLVPRREALVVSWLTSSGTFIAPRTGRSETDPGTSSESTFIAPRAGHGTVFLVLRDSRGGVAYRSIPFAVR